MISFREYIKESNREKTSRSRRMFEAKDRVQPKNGQELADIVRDTIFEDGLGADLNFIDTSKVKSMAGLFDGSPFKDFDGDISKWDTSNVENMSFMFKDSKFKGDISKWDVSKVKDMDFMFFESKFNGDISKWNVHNVRRMQGMFQDSRFNKDISKWDVSKVEKNGGMFGGCPLENKPKLQPKFNDDLD